MLFLHLFAPVLGVIHPLLAATATNAEIGKEGLRSVALGVGAAGGAAGAGAGIGSVFNASIQAKTRQPELRADIERDQWLGFALTEACFFYGLVGGFIAFFL
jgi:F-type H+-transporting ATPase subunit c